MKWISVRLVLPIVICGTIAVGLQTTIAGGPKLAAADLPQLASLAPEAAPEATADAAEPVALPRQSAAPGHSPGHGPGNARHEAAAAMLLLLVATARSNRERGENAQRQASAAERTARPASHQTADARQVR